MRADLSIKGYLIRVIQSCITRELCRRHRRGTIKVIYAMQIACIVFCRAWNPSGCGAASPSQGRWDPDTLRPALSLGGQATAGERSPGRSLCLTKSSACGRLWQFAQPRPLSLLQRGLAPRSKGKARAELRPARRQSRLPHSRSLLLPGRER